MARLETNPRYRDLLDDLGLVHALDFRALPTVLIRRHEGRVMLGAGLQAVPALFKWTDRGSWWDRLASARAGFGFVSPLRRECAVLRAAEQAGVGCPEWIAAGEDDRGRAFLLLRELTGLVELPTYLREARHGRRRFARRLGEAVARLHAAGLDHPELCAQHLLVDRRGQDVFVHDWQRACLRRRLGWRQRWRNLAVLDVSLGGELAPRPERLAFLGAYLRASGLFDKPVVEDAAHSIHRFNHRLLRQPQYKVLREASLTGARVELP